MNYHYSIHRNSKEKEDKEREATLLKNKRKILNLLLPALQATRNLHDLAALEYDAEEETVTACETGGGRNWLM